MKAIRNIAALALLAATVLGAWALAVRFREGLIVTHMTQHVPWGLWVALYIYFIGLSAGSFLLATLVYVFRVRAIEAVGPLALLQALVCMLVALFAILVDLGHPERFLNVLVYWNPTSVLAWEVLFYTGYIVLILLELHFALRPQLAARARAGGPAAWFYALCALGTRDPDEAWRRRAAKWLWVLGLIGIPVAIGVHGGTGAIFAVVKSRPNWYTGLLPMLFIISALASGGALLTFLAAVLMRGDAESRQRLVRFLARLTIGFIALDFLFLCSEILVTYYGGIPHHVAGWRDTLFGPYWWVFWFGQVGLGVVFPVAVLLHPKGRASVMWLGAVGAAVVVAVVGVRLNIVIPPLIAPEFEALPQAYHHLRFATGYFPSANEWGVAAGIFALAAWLLLAGIRILPVRPEVEGGSA